MGIPFGCKIGKHSWTSANADGVKTCKFCKKDYSIWKVHSLWYGTAGHGIHDGDGGE